MIISYKHGFVFVHIHKTAGESISAALAPQLGRGDLRIEGDPGTALRRRMMKRYRAAGELNKHSPATMIRSHIGASTWHRMVSFAVVRDPARRALSLYTYLQAVRDRVASSRARRIWYSTPLGRSSNPDLWAGMRALRETSDFSEFIRHPDALADPGFQKQVSMVRDGDGRCIVSRIIRLENLAEEFRNVQREIGFDTYVELPHENRSSGRGAAGGPGELSADDRQHLAAVFADDYEAFGYAPQ